MAKELRQEDPSSSYLFLFYDEGLSSGNQRRLFLLKKSKRLCLAKQRAKENFDCLEHATEQQVNFDKSTISFGWNIAQVSKEEIPLVLGVNEITS